MSANDRKHRRRVYLETLLEDVNDICGEDSYSAADLKQIIEYWDGQPADEFPDSGPTRADALRTEVAGLKNEMLRRQGHKTGMGAKAAEDGEIRVLSHGTFRWDGIIRRWVSID